MLLCGERDKKMERTKRKMQKRNVVWEIDKLIIGLSVLVIIKGNTSQQFILVLVFKMYRSCQWVGEYWKPTLGLFSPT